MKALLNLRSPEVITQITMKNSYAVKVVLPLVLAGMVSCTRSEQVPDLEQVTEDGERFPIEWLNDHLSYHWNVEFFEWTPPVPFDGSNYLVCQTVENGEVISERNLGESDTQLLAEITKDKPLWIALKLYDVDEDDPGHGERFCRFLFLHEEGYFSRSVEKLPGSIVSFDKGRRISGEFELRFTTELYDHDTRESLPSRRWSYRLVQRDTSPEETPK